jgi:dipeptidyl aminopeptidase/acylaminoacyl peptidase
VTPTISCALAALVAAGCSRADSAPPELPAPAPPPEKPYGTIAYARGPELRVIEPDGGGDRLVWKAPDVPGEKKLAFTVTGPAWRPDGGELAFASDHEQAMSPYATDLYAVRGDGSNLRKLTNPPAHALLGRYPAGSVTVLVQTITPGPFFVYVQGADEPQVITTGRRVTFKSVADLGDVAQAVSATNGADHWLGVPVDVKAGKHTDAGLLTISALGGIPGHGAAGPFWRADGKEVGFLAPICQPARVPAAPPPGVAATPIVAPEAAKGLCIAEWGPGGKLAAGTIAFDGEGKNHVYLLDEGARRLPAPLASFDRYRRVTDLHWHPSGRSLVVARQDDLTDEDINLHEVDVATGKSRQLTTFAFGGEKLRRFAISPDARTIVFERTADLLHGKSDLWIANLDGSGLRRLAPNAGFPAWNPKR